jgi:uncharacterized protein (UPF0147 family)
MDATSMKELIEKFNTGHATSSELLEIERLIEKGQIAISDLNDLQHLEDRILSAETPAPSLKLDDKFYDLLTKEKRLSANAFNWKKFFSLPELMPRLAFATVALLIGLAGGYFLKPSSSQPDMHALTQEVADLKEMMMLSLLEKESATDRLKAVSLTEEMDQASQKVTSALLQTLNEDSNVNVRLAALDALKPYSKDSHVRQELIRSIAQQESPLVQIALAELMAELHEKSSVQELTKILKDKKTPRDVKKRVKESIDVLT